MRDVVEIEEDLECLDDRRLVVDEQDRKVVAGHESILEPAPRRRTGGRARQTVRVAISGATRVARSAGSSAARMPDTQMASTPTASSTQSRCGASV